MKLDKKSVGRRIRQIRLSLGMTTEEFGNCLNTSKGSVSKWENGRYLPVPKTLTDIAFYGQISVEELLEGDVIKIETAELFYSPTNVRQYLSVGLTDEEIEDLTYELDCDYDTIITVLERASIYVNMSELPKTITLKRYEEEITNE